MVSPTFPKVYLTKGRPINWLIITAPTTTFTRKFDTIGNGKTSFAISTNPTAKLALGKSASPKYFFTFLGALDTLVPIQTPNCLPPMRITRMAAISNPVALSILRSICAPAKQKKGRTEALEFVQLPGKILMSLFQIDNDKTHNHVGQ